jgi:Domain of unknown function (DUF4440)
MKQVLFVCSFAVLLAACSAAKSKQSAAPAYQPVSQALYDTIVRLDSIFFAAYNSCNLTVCDSLMSKDMEFYHDQGGLTTSQEGLIESLRKNICGKVTRTLFKGSNEVYPIPNYGAVQMGRHYFTNNQEPPTTTPKIGKFVTIWKRYTVGWKMTRVVSLH